MISFEHASEEQLRLISLRNQIKAALDQQEAEQDSCQVWSEFDHLGGEAILAEWLSAAQKAKTDEKHQGQMRTVNTTRFAPLVRPTHEAA